MRVLLRCLQGVVWLGLAVGWGTQLFLRDRWDGWAVVFYALPKPLLGLAALGLAAIAAGRQRRIAGLLAAAAGVWWLATSWCWNPPPPAAAAAGDVRLLFWNLSRPDGAHAGLIDLVREFEPHFAACVEPGPVTEATLAAYQTSLPGYEAAFMPRGILWLARSASRYRQRGKLDGLGAFAVFDVLDLGPAFPVVAVDVYAHPLLSRRRQMSEALALTGGRPDAMLIGDFNTPLESVHYQPYRQQLAHAFEAAGRGFRETWFWGLPLLSLDHVWLGRDWQVVSARKVQTRASDHSALLVTVRR